MGVRDAGFTMAATPLTLRHNFVTHLLHADGDVGTVQELLGHTDMATTTIYTNALCMGGSAVRSPSDSLSSTAVHQSSRWCTSALSLKRTVESGASYANVDVRELLFSDS